MVTKFDIDKFDGKISFAIWKVHMQAVLTHHGYKKALGGIAHKPQSMADEDRLELDEKALTTIQLFLTREVLREVIHETTAAGTSVQHHLDEFNTILIDLENLDVDIDDEDKAPLLVISLPASYKHFKEIILYGNRETLSFDDVKSALLSKQKYDDNVEPESGEGLVARGRSSDRAIAKGDSDGNVYLAIDTEKSRDELIVDSGCTFYMIPHRSWFTTYESFNGGNLYMGNHSICPVIEKDLKRNLISLSTLEANGCKYSGEGGVMKIFKGALVLMKTIQSGGLYVLQGTVVYGTAGVATSKASLDDSKLWHYRLGHIGEKDLLMAIFQKYYGQAIPLIILILEFFGCPVYVHVNKGKLVPRAVKCIFLGYGSGVKGYRVWCPHPKYRKIIHSKDVTFNEDVIINSEHIETQDDGIMPTSPQSQPQTEYLLARDRKRRQVNRPPRLEDYQCDLVAYAFAVVARIENCEATNYIKAISSPECDKWVVAMEEEIRELKDQLSNEFDMNDLGVAKRILGMEIRRDRKIATHFTLSSHECPKSEEDKEDMSRVPYSSAVGSFMYAMEAVKCILCYLKGTSNIGLSFEKGHASPNGVVGYVDSDYAGDLDARKYLFSYIFSHCGSAIRWYSSLQAITALSTIEAQYISSTEGVKEAIWLRGMVNEFVLPQEEPKISVVGDFSYVCQCFTKGFSGIKFSYLGGFLVLLEFDSLQSCNKFHTHNGIKSRFSSLCQWTPHFEVVDRVVWIDVEGTPLHAWSRSTFNKIASKWGELVYLDDSNVLNKYNIRLCVKTRVHHLIAESFKVENSTYFEEDYDDNSVGIQNWVEEGDIEELEESINNLLDDGTTYLEPMNKSSGGSMQDHVEFMARPNKPVNGFSILECFQEFINIGKAMGYGMKGSARGRSGGILCVWDKTLFQKKRIYSIDNCLCVEGTWLVTNSDLLFMSVYSPQELSHKRALWAYMLGIINNWHGEVVAMRDFNEVHFASEWHGSSFHALNATEFNTFIVNSHLIDNPLDLRLDKGESLLDELSKRVNVLRDLKAIDQKISVDLTQIAKVQWAIEGDGNSKFFPGIVNKKIRPLELKVSWSIENGLTTCLIDLERDVTIEEVKKEVWDCGSDKFPGLDGFTFEFFKRFWSIVGGDVIHALAFIKGRQITDGPLILNEIISWCKYKKEESLMFKVNFQKAFDSVRWDYLNDILGKLGFDNKWLIDGGLFIPIFIGIDYKIPISHLFYADDDMFIRKCLYVVGVRFFDIQYMADRYSFLANNLSFTYLGVKVGVNMNRVILWNDVVQKDYKDFVRIVTIDRKVKNLSVDHENKEWMSIFAALSRGFGIWSIRRIERDGYGVSRVSWSRDHVQYLLEYFITLSRIWRIGVSWIRRIGLCSFVVFYEVQAQIRCVSWIRRIGLCSFVVFCEVQAHIRRIFLDGYGV
nr:retrovirus-related Pol polyprotein from transposon TNT 1-94 [Tanacetum cinerariifolium]